MSVFDELFFTAPFVRFFRKVRTVLKSKSEEELSEEDICWLLFGCAPEDVNWGRVADKVNEGNLSVARCAEIFNKIHQQA